MSNPINCQDCQRQFSIDAAEREFLGRIAPVVADQTFFLPEPTLCPDCRQNRRWVWRNERKLYRRQCSKTGEEIVSIYAPDKPYPVYKNSVWWGDDWDALSFGRDVDLTRSFFPQLAELFKVVPQIATNMVDSEDSEYGNQSWHIKSCYLCFNAQYSESCYYSDEIYSCANCVDCLAVKHCERCYGCIDCQYCQRAVYLQDCERVSDSAFSYDCRNCSNIFLCTNLRNKQYCYANEQLTKEAYEAKLTTIDLGDCVTFERMTREFEILKAQAALANHNVSIEDCRGDYLVECARCTDCLFCLKAEDCRYAIYSTNARDCQDLNHSAEIEHSYQCAMTSGYHHLYCVMVIGGQENLFNYSCWSSSNLFGCVGLRNKQYCILNKQYSKEEYERLVPKIIELMKTHGEWGQFLPSGLSPFGFNESVAQLKFPKDKASALAYGATWQDNDFAPQYDGPTYQPKENVRTYRDSADEADQLLNSVLKCSATARPFKLVGPELAFYIEHNLPIPTKHPDIRYEERVKQRNAPITFRNLDSGEIDELPEAA
jgi:hypothetical protein